MWIADIPRKIRNLNLIAPVFPLCQMEVHIGVGSTFQDLSILYVFGSSKKNFSASVPGSRIVSRATSPISRRASPPRSTTPTPTLGGLTSPRVANDGKPPNDALNQEVLNLRSQVHIFFHF
jgi:hypothetical protein